MSMLSIQAAANQYATRPKDERFATMDEWLQSARDDKDNGTERVYNLKDLRVVAGTLPDRANGKEHGTVRLASPRGEALFTAWSFGQLCRGLGAPTSYLAQELSTDLAAQCLNYGLQNSPVGTTAKLLARSAPAGSGIEYPIVRAASTEKYGRLYDADLGEGLKSRLLDHDPSWTTPPTWTPGESAGLYRGDRDSFMIYVNGGSIVEDPTLRAAGVSTRGAGADAGAMFRGLLIKNSEVGSASVTIERILFRYVCGNHMLWGAVLDNTFRRRHVGDQVLNDTIKEISAIAFTWSQQSTARDNALIRGLIDREIASTKEAVIDELKAIGATKDQAIKMYERCEQTESVSPRSFWGLAQGATRISQDAVYQDERYQLDRIAAQVMQRGAKLARV